jgi:ectoine hydroxylase-related dioxygenase (phytanoyl-CoA dioxygenase family)
VVEGPEINGLMMRLIGGPVQTYDTKWLRVVAPGESTETHSVRLRQDFYRFQAMQRAQTYICWVPLGPCSMRQGPLVVCSTSHTVDYDQGVIPGTEIPTSFYDMVEGSQWLSHDFEAGDACVFNVKSLHGSLKY